MTQLSKVRTAAVLAENRPLFDEEKLPVSKGIAQACCR